ncbi:hypothetical protein COCCADRAFT_68199, partial [Bipolaris zeicola 26-R-13]
ASLYLNIRSLHNIPYLPMLWCFVQLVLLSSASILELRSEGLHPLFDPKKNPGMIGSAASQPVDISELRNNRAFGIQPRDANFDGNGAGYPAQHLPQENLSYGGLGFVFPQYQPDGGYDNVLAQGQVLNISQGSYLAVHMLVASENSIVTSAITASYVDGSTTTSSVIGFPWWSWSSVWSPWHYAGDLMFPFHFTNMTTNYNQSSIFRTVNWLDSTKKLAQLKLPNVTSGAANGPGGVTQNTRLHIFAVSLVPANISTGAMLEVQLARSTNSWLEGSNMQIFEATILNVGTQWVLPEHNVLITIEGEASSTRTVRPASIKRLRPGDEAR